MKISVQFNYTESVIPPRCRKARITTKGDGVVEVDIQEVTADQAPVAIRVSGTTLAGDLPFTYDLRLWEGQLWTPVLLDQSCEPRGSVGAKNDWDCPALPEVLDLRTGIRNQCFTYQFFGSFGQNLRADVEADIQAFVKRHLVIEGKPYRLATEPRYVVMTFGLSNNHGGTSVLASADAHPNLKPEVQYGLAELVDALEYATGVAQKRGDSNNLPMQYAGPTFEVLMPEALSFRNPVLDATRSVVCEPGSGKELILQGYKVEAEVFDTVSNVLEAYKGQGVRILRGKAAPDAEGKATYFVMVRLPVVHLSCSECETPILGRQWHNRLDGWGICPACADACQAKDSPEWFKSCFGTRGVHFDIKR